MMEGKEEERKEARKEERKQGRKEERKKDIKKERNGISKMKGRIKKEERLIS